VVAKNADVCAHQKVVDLQKGVHDYLEHETSGDITPQVNLSDEARQRIADALKESS
jgi:hypothetical protein